MITNFKIFESLNNGDPDVGDYVLCKSIITDEMSDFLINNVGRISYNDIRTYPSRYTVTYDNVPYRLGAIFNYNYTTRKHYFYFNRNDILYWSKDKNDIEMMIQSNKYNI